MSGGYSIVDLSKYAVAGERYFCPLSEMSPDITAALLDEKPVYLKNLTFYEDNVSIKVDCYPTRVSGPYGEVIYLLDTPFSRVMVMLNREDFTIEVMKGN